MLMLLKLTGYVKSCSCNLYRAWTTREATTLPSEGTGRPSASYVIEGDLGQETVKCGDCKVGARKTVIGVCVLIPKSGPGNAFFLPDDVNEVDEEVLFNLVLERHFKYVETRTLA